MIADEFRQAIAATGLTPPEVIHPDGKLHRFPSNGRRDDDAGYYVLFTDGIPAGMFGDWRTGLKETWCSRGADTLTEAERRAHLARIARMKAEREAEERR